MASFSKPSKTYAKDKLVWFQAGALGHVSLEFKAVRYESV